jgi:hypothetical protein
MAFCDSKIMGCGSIRPQLIRDELVWDKAIFLQKFAHQFQRRTLVPSALDQHVEHFALGVDGTPQIDHAAIDLEIDFVEMPSRMWLRPAFAKIGRDLESEMVYPAAHGLVGHHDAAFRQQILDVAEAQGEPDIKPDRLLDDFGREPAPCRSASILVRIQVPPVEKERHGEATDATIEAVIAAERQRCINRVLTYAALRDQAAIELDKAASGSGSEKPSEGAAERARAQADEARDIARFLGEETKA